MIFSFPFGVCADIGSFIQSADTYPHVMSLTVFDYVELERKGRTGIRNIVTETEITEPRQ